MTLHTDTFTLDEVNEAFDLLKSGSAVRIMIKIGEMHEKQWIRGIDCL